MRALITGVTGQDGSYLAEQLTAAGNHVVGLVRGQSQERQARITELVPGLVLVEGDLQDQSSLIRAVEASGPDVVFNLAAMSAPALAWRQPELTGDVTGLGFTRLMEAVRLVAPTARVVQASSVALHGPYGAAKTYAHAMAGDYRARGLYVSTAVMTGHHSPRRGWEFFSRMVTRAAARAKTEPGAPKLTLGWLGRRQDWGWAPNFAAGLRAVAEAGPGDYVLATGDPHTSEEWVAAAFAAAGLDWRDHVVVDEAARQPTEVPVLSGQPDPRSEWEPDCDFTGLARWMVAADRGLPESAVAW